MVATPINMEGLESGVRQVAPLAPADTDDVLAEIGYSAAEIAQMRAEHVI
jgi:crotonobetainyl-CoA:carnitine CoA-transferase CaiB-like acyl-CoA transferase